jgi:hypothetical protein
MPARRAPSSVASGLNRSGGKRGGLSTIMTLSIQAPVSSLRNVVAKIALRDLEQLLDHGRRQ